MGHYLFLVWTNFTYGFSCVFTGSHIGFASTPSSLVSKLSMVFLEKKTGFKIKFNVRSMPSLIWTSNRAIAKYIVQTCAIGCPGPGSVATATTIILFNMVAELPEVPEVDEGQCNEESWEPVHGAHVPNYSQSEATQFSSALAWLGIPTWDSKFFLTWSYMWLYMPHICGYVRRIV